MPEGDFNRWLHTLTVFDTKSTMNVFQFKELPRGYQKTKNEKMYEYHEIIFRSILK